MPDIIRGPEPLAIIVMGVSGSGKSTLGAALADSLHCPFLDGDTFHAPEAIAKMRAGQALTDEDRWPWLDRIAAANKDAVDHHGIVVTACSALRRVYRDRLRNTNTTPTLFILLEGDRDELWRRLSNRAGHYMPVSLLSSQLETLELPDRDEPALMLDARKSPAALRDEVIAWLATHRTS